MPWIVIMTKPNSESLAAENLKRQGYEPYCPRYLFERPGKSSLIRPLFPRYMFVWIDKAWYSIRGTRGVSTVLMGDEGPATISDAIITQLRSREDKKGLLRLTPCEKFAQGSKVRAPQGPLAGHLLTYAGLTSKDRVRVLIEMLGRQVPVELKESELVAA